MSVTINGTTGITTTGLTTTANNVLGDASTDTLNVGNGTIVTDGSGNVGIGTSSPTTRLQVGDATVSSANKITFGKTAATTQTTLPTIYCGNELVAGASPDLILETGSTGGGLVVRTGNPAVTRMAVDASGNVTIGGVGILGIGQSWSDVTASRALGTTYTNSTGKPIQVMMNYNGTSSTSRTLTAVVNGTTIMSVTTNYICPTLNFIVPSGATYSITSSGGLLLGLWSELR